VIGRPRLSDQALIYTLAVAPGSSRMFMIAGAAILVLGIVALALGILLGRKEAGLTETATRPPATNIA